MGYLSFLYRQAFVHPPQIPPTVSLKKQAVLITGANSGIGLEAARQCVGLEAEVVILAVRMYMPLDSYPNPPGSSTQLQIHLCHPKLTSKSSGSMEKGEVAKAGILKSNPTSKSHVEIWELDMESFDSVLAFGKRSQDLPQLDIAMLNAGTFKFDWSTSPTSGIESSLQVNHLSTALISLLLLPVLRKTSKVLQRPSRLTFTSSEVHKVCWIRMFGVSQLS